MKQLKGKFEKYPLLTAFICGWLAVAALPPFYLFPLLFVSFSILIWLIHHASSAAKAFKTGYAFGFAFFAFGFSWIGNALLIDAATFGWLCPIVFLACGFFFGLFIAVPAWTSFFFRKLPAQYLAFCALWVFSEWVRSFILTGFPWNLLGSVLAFDNRFIQFAAVGGTYSLSLLVLLSVAAPVFWLEHPNKVSARISAAIPLCLLFFLGLYGSIRQASFSDAVSDTRIRLVQPAIPQTMKWQPAVLEENFNTYVKMSQKAGMDDIDFIIWGETASPFPLDIDEYHLQTARYAVPPEGFLITGMVRYEFVNDTEHNAYNSMIIIDSQGKTVGRYDKSHLVPFGEYVPLRGWLPLDKVVPISADFVAGNGPATRHIPKAPPASLLVCYEIIFPNAVVADKPKRPDWIINVTNDGWYGLSAGPYQHLGMAQLRAVEEGMPVVRVANTGISAVIDSYGRLLKTLPLGTQGVLDSPLPRAVGATFYALFGNIPLFVLCLLGIFWTRPRRKK